MKIVFVGTVWIQNIWLVSHEPLTVVVWVIRWIWSFERTWIILYNFIQISKIIVILSFNKVVNFISFNKQLFCLSGCYRIFNSQHINLILHVSLHTLHVCNSWVVSQSSHSAFGILRSIILFNQLQIMLMSLLFSIHLFLKVTLKMRLHRVTSLLEASDVTGSLIGVNLVDFHDRYVV